ncbi:MAG: hypothetical protein R3186_05000 [Ruegeria sp.]|nr:hypothetical protein [Ruegeria sp.]
MSKTDEEIETVVELPSASLPTNLSFAEHAVTRFYHNPKHGVTIQMVENPRYWTHVATKLKAGARIEVLAEDQSYWADLLVLSASRLEARVIVLDHVELNQVEAADEVAGDGLEVAWRGPSAKWGVIRSVDREPLKDGFQSKDAALMWLKNRRQNMVA